MGRLPGEWIDFCRVVANPGDFKPEPAMPGRGRPDGGACDPDRHDVQEGME
jgi:hypothetical protein